MDGDEKDSYLLPAQEAQIRGALKVLAEKVEALSRNAAFQRLEKNDPARELAKAAISYVTMIEEEKSDATRDIFDLPATELKNLIRGIVWRDKHFDGMTIRQIADEESFSEAFVGKCISRSFDVLQGC